MRGIDLAKKFLEKADGILITAGAGMGVDSGLADFRGKEGFWKAYPIAKKLGLSFQDLANPDWFNRDPYLAWAFYGHRLDLYRKTVPHRGFYLLREFVRKKDDNYFVFTSNVDGQFQKAGFEEGKIVEIHGSIHFFQCIEPCSDDIWSGDGVNVDVDMETFLAKDPLPKCKNCLSISRPNILMFSDYSWVPNRTKNQEFRLERWLERNEGKNVVIVEIGAGKAIPTVRIFGEKISLYYGFKLIRINPVDHDVPSNLEAVSVPFGGLEAIERMLE